MDSSFARKILIICSLILLFLFSLIPIRLASASDVICGRVTLKQDLDTGEWVKVLKTCDKDEYYYLWSVDGYPPEAYYRCEGPVIKSISCPYRFKFGYVYYKITRCKKIITICDCSCCESTPTPTRTTTPTPTLIPTLTLTPTPTETSGPNPEQVRQWIVQKEHLISSLGLMDIPTSLLSVPAVHAYDESQAQELLNRLKPLVESGNLSLQAADALSRWVIQERTMVQMLPNYTEVAATLVKTTFDSLFTFFGVVRVIYPVVEICQKALGVSLCGPLSLAVKSLEQRTLQDFTHWMIAVASQKVEPIHREALVKVVTLGTDIVFACADDGDCFVALLQGQVPPNIDTILIKVFKKSTLDAAATWLFIQPYLNKTQGLLNKGVYTTEKFALGSSSSKETWMLTGNTQRAESLTAELVDKARAEKDLAASRYQNFARTAQFAKTAEDIADLNLVINDIKMTPPGGGLVSKILSNLFKIELVIKIGFRVEHLLLNLWGGTWNFQSLRCVDYLSGRAAEMSFNSQVPGDDCKYMPPLIQFSVLGFASYPMHPLQRELAMSVDEYRQSLAGLSSAVQSGDQTTINQALNKFSHAEETLGRDLSRIQAILLAKPEGSTEALAFMDKKIDLENSNLGIYLTVFGVVAARQSGAQAPFDLEQARQKGESSAQEVNLAASQVDLTLPSGVPVLYLASVEQSNVQPGTLEIEVENLGTGTAYDVQAAMIADGELLGQPSTLAEIAARQKAHLSLTIPSSAPDLMTVRLSMQGKLVDIYPVRNQTVFIPKPPEAPSGGTGGAGVAFVLVLVGIGVVAVFVTAQRRKKRAVSFSPSMKNASLYIVSGQQAGQRFQVIEPSYVIGRHSSCNLPIQDIQMSRRHAQLQYSQGAWLIRDLDSKNGTLLNGHPVTASALKSGDRITVGDTTLIFQENG